VEGEKKRNGRSRRLREAEAPQKESHFLFFFWGGVGLKRAVLWCYVELVEETGFLS